MSSLREERHARVVAALVEGALQIARRDGWGGLDLRSLAKKLRFSTIVVYRHVGSKQGLIAAIQSHGFHKLRQVFVRRAAASRIPTERIRRLSAGFVEFAAAEPELYRLMFGLAGVESTHPPYESIMAAGEIVKEALRRIVPAEEVDSAFLKWWAICQGFISIQINPEMSPAAAAMKRAFASTLETYLDALRGRDAARAFKPSS